MSLEDGNGSRGLRRLELARYSQVGLTKSTLCPGQSGICRRYRVFRFPVWPLVDRAAVLAG